MQWNAIKWAAIVSIGLFSSLGTPSAQAATFNWSFNLGVDFSGSGTLETGAAEPNNGFLITSMTGTWTDQAGTQNISLMPVGHFDTISPNDNILYPTSTLLLDVGGLAFSGALEAVHIFIFSLGGGEYAVATLPADLCPTAGCGTGNFASGAGNTFTITATPLPAALPLFATGIGALGLLGWRRKRKALA